MSNLRLNEDELIAAFQRYLPKQHVYPNVTVSDDEDDLDNSQTESEGSDTEEDQPGKRFKVRVVFKDEMSQECLKLWENSPCMRPSEYLERNIRKELEKALCKLINLKNKPKNPIEWLGFELFSMNINDPRAPSQDHLHKPSAEQLNFGLRVALNHEHVPVRVIQSNPMYQTGMTACPVVGVKRKHPEPLN